MIIAAAALVLAAAIAVVVFFYFYGKNSRSPTILVNPYGGEPDSPDTISVRNEGDSYRLDLPADADRKNLKIWWYPEEQSMSVNGKQLAYGESTSVFGVRDSYSLTFGGENYSLKLEQSLDLPAVFLVTDSRKTEYLLADKDNKEPGRAVVRENGEAVIDAELEHIKGRGNHWDEYVAPARLARPYNIKFKEKTELLGMASAKKWVLKPTGIVEDNSAYALARRMGLSFTPELRSADVYLNNVYLGKYQISSSVQVSGSRVDIADLKELNEKANPSVDFKTLPKSGTSAPDDLSPGCRKWVEAPNDPDDITGGYLIEVDDSDHYAEDVSGFITDRGFTLVIKDPEYATRSEVEYIADYWQEAEDALYSETGYNSLGKHYGEYFDMDSLVRIYILQEITKNADSGVTSCFFYKDAGGKLFAGPAWDYDAALGLEYEYEGLDLNDPGTWWVNQRVRDWWDDYPLLFCALYSREDFRSAVFDMWEENADAWLSEDYFSELYAFGESLAATSTGVFSQRGAAYIESRDRVIRFLKERKTALDLGFSPDAAYVRYDAGGGTGHIYETAMYRIGDGYTLKENAYEKDGSEFKGWSTVPGGEAEYQPGDGTTLETGYTVFYAVWE